MDVYAYQRIVNEYMAKRKKLDVNAVYAQLKDSYNLVLTNAFSLKNGEKDYDSDFEMLCGESSAGKFQLYDNGLHFVFDVDKSDGTYTHWHPMDIAEAKKDVQAFMQGICKE